MTDLAAATRRALRRLLGGRSSPEIIAGGTVLDGATAAEQGYLGSDGAFTAPEPVGPASGSVFSAAAVDFEPGEIFAALREELSDPVIVDFAVQGGPDGSAVYDATVLSDSGGTILVLLAPDGTVLGAQAA